MQQLTLQFEGYADEMRQPQTQGTATQCQTGDFYKDIQQFFHGLAKSVTKPSSKILERAALLGQAAAVVTVGFGLCFMAAIIGG